MTHPVARQLHDALEVAFPDSLCGVAAAGPQFVDPSGDQVVGIVVGFYPVDFVHLEVNPGARPSESDDRAVVNSGVRGLLAVGVGSVCAKRCAFPVVLVVKQRGMKPRDVTVFQHDVVLGRATDLDGFLSREPPFA